MYWFNTQRDEHGNIRVVVPQGRQADVAEYLRKSEYQGVPEHVAITLLQDQLARLQALLAPLAPLPPEAGRQRPPSRGGRGTFPMAGGSAPATIGSWCPIAPRWKR